MESKLESVVWIRVAPGDVINELLQQDRAAVCVWLEASVRNLPQLVTNPTTPVVTRKQLVDFHQLIVAADSSTDVSHALREFSRLGFRSRSYLRSQYFLLKDNYFFAPLLEMMVFHLQRNTLIFTPPSTVPSARLLWPLDFLLIFKFCTCHFHVSFLLHVILFIFTLMSNSPSPFVHDSLNIGERKQLCWKCIVWQKTYI